MGPDVPSAGVFARFVVIALTAFLTVVDLFATQAIPAMELARANTRQRL
jgi:hypothetical protein